MGRGRTFATGSCLRARFLFRGKKQRASEDTKADFSNITGFEQCAVLYDCQFSAYSERASPHTDARFLKRTVTGTHLIHRLAYGVVGGGRFQVKHIGSVGGKIDCSLYSL